MIYNFHEFYMVLQIKKLINLKKREFNYIIKPYKIEIKITAKKRIL